MARLPRRPTPLPLLFCLALAGGCVADRRIALEPPVRDSALPIPASSASLPPLLVAAPVDRREHPRLVGEVRGLWAMHVGQVETDTDVAAWTRAALLSACAAQGLQVEPAGGSENRESEFLLESTIQRVYCADLDGLEAVVRLRVVFWRLGRVDFRRTYESHHRPEDGPEPSAADRDRPAHALCLEAALEDAASAVAADVAREIRG